MHVSIFFNQKIKLKKIIKFNLLPQEIKSFASWNSWKCSRQKCLTLKIPNPMDRPVTSLLEHL